MLDVRLKTINRKGLAVCAAPARFILNRNYSNENGLPEALLLLVLLLFVRIFIEGSYPKAVRLRLIPIIQPASSAPVGCFSPTGLLRLN